MERDASHIADIVMAAQLAIGYLADTTHEAFLSNVQLQDSVIRRLEILGEASRRVSSATRISASSIPWTEMIGMRNLMIHEYDSIDLETVWDTVKRDLPELINQLRPLLP